jgi:hypothetical protein
VYSSVAFWLASPGGALPPKNTPAEGDPVEPTPFLAVEPLTGFEVQLVPSYSSVAAMSVTGGALEPKAAAAAVCDPKPPK